MYLSGQSNLNDYLPRDWSLKWTCSVDILYVTAAGNM